MTRIFNYISQGTLVAANVFNFMGGVIPPKWQAPIGIAIGTLQFVVSQVAHVYNVDGTNQRTAYIPPSPSQSPLSGQ